jgi:hypothetical protein
MAFNGSGTFVRLYSWANDKIALIKIRADRMDNEMNGFATGLSNCITRDGQSPATGNIPMGGNKITGLGTGTSSTDAATVAQINTAVPSIVDVTGNKTLALSDAGTIQNSSSGSAVVVTVPANATVAFPIGTSIRIDQDGAGGVSITGAVGVTINGVSAGTSVILARYRGGILTKIATDSWHLQGAIA